MWHRRKNVFSVVRETPDIFDSYARGESQGKDQAGKHHSKRCQNQRQSRAVVAGAKLAKRYRPHRAHRTDWRESRREICWVIHLLQHPRAAAFGVARVPYPSFHETIRGNGFARSGRRKAAPLARPARKDLRASPLSSSGRRAGRFSDFGVGASVRRSGEIWRRSRKPPCRTNAYGRLSIYQ